ncbi:MAG: hypothetical protein K2W96_06670 [Gemmataceae bacterium]|nr:hypothetical protein [Gemmataceae bacterium]
MHALAVLFLLAADPAGVIIQFNGKKAGGASADTKDKAFKAVFEKDLAAIAAKLPGKPKLSVNAWFTIINGGSVRWEKPAKDLPEKLKAELDKLPYVKMVELDVPTPPPGGSR